MNRDDRPTLHPGTLVRGLLADLGTLVREGGPVGEIGKDGDGVAQLRRLGAALRERRAAADEELATRYRDRAGAMREVIQARQQRVEAYTHRLRQAVPPEPGKYILAGRLTDEGTGVPLPNVVVRLQDDTPGAAPTTAHTDALGYFRLELTLAGAGRTGGRAGDVRVEVLDAEGKVLGGSERSFHAEPGRSDFVKLRVAGGRVPRSLELGRTVERAVEERLSRLRRTERVVAQGPPLRRPGARGGAP